MQLLLQLAPRPPRKGSRGGKMCLHGHQLPSSTDTAGSATPGTGHSQVVRGAAEHSLAKIWEAEKSSQTRRAEALHPNRQTPEELKPKGTLQSSWRILQALKCFFITLTRAEVIYLPPQAIKAPKTAPKCLAPPEFLSLWKVCACCLALCI